MNEMQIFDSEELGQVRTVVIDNEPFFVGKDVAQILGYANPRKAIIDHVDEEDKTDGVTICDSIGREQNPICINESGLYALVFGSKLEAAKKFKHWVTSEILPTLRKSGSYPRVPVNPIASLGLSPQLQAMINLELKQKEQDEKLAALEDKTDRQSAAIETVRSAMVEPEKEESFSHWVSAVIENVASSPHYQDNPYRYQTAWGESYKRLAAKSGCRLEILLKNAKKRAAENGAPKSKIKLISKLSVIASDKRLKALYISVLQEMTVAYCTEVMV